MGGGEVKKIMAKLPLGLGRRRDERSHREHNTGEDSVFSRVVAVCTTRDGNNERFYTAAYTYTYVYYTPEICGESFRLFDLRSARNFENIIIARRIHRVLYARKTMRKKPVKINNTYLQRFTQSSASSSFRIHTLVMRCTGELGFRSIPL